MKLRLRDGSGERRYKYVIEDMDRHSKVRLYFRRRPDPKILLREKPGTPEFEAEYLRAYMAEAYPAAREVVRSGSQPGTVRWLAERYYMSAAFQSLDPETRRVRRRILDRICERVGMFSYKTMEPRDVVKLRDEKAATPEAANSIVKALRAVFGWASSPEYALATHNPAKSVTYLASHNPEGHHTWTEAEAQQFEARHPFGTKARLALDLFIYTGQRISDVARLGPQMERDGKLCFTEFKGRSRTPKHHELPILPPLRASIDAYYAAGNPRHLIYLATQTGAQHSIKGLGNWFARQCRMAGIDQGLSAHGLRKFAAVRCAESGATEIELMAIFGWTNPRQAALYTRRANRARLEAKAATTLLREAPRAPMSENANATESGEKVQPFGPGVVRLDL